MKRIIRTVLASVGAAAVVSGGALGVAVATTPAPAQTADQGAAPGSGLNETVDDLVAQINKLEKDLAEPMPTLSTPTPTPEAGPPVGAAAPATRAAPQAPAAPGAPAARTTTASGSDDEKKSGDLKKDSDD